MIKTNSIGIRCFDPDYIDVFDFHNKQFLFCLWTRKSFNAARAADYNDRYLYRNEILVDSPYETFRAVKEFVPDIYGIGGYD